MFPPGQLYLQRAAVAGGAEKHRLLRPARSGFRRSSTCSITYRAWSVSLRTVTSRGGPSDCRSVQRFLVKRSSREIVTALAVKISWVER